MRTKDYELPGQFYLGRDLHSLASTSGGRSDQVPYLYDSRDLLTHGVCIGMTGSGKTGLCLSILEEAAMDEIPVIAIDPKGDLGNLLLTFPNLTVDEFMPWVSKEEAQRLELSVEEYARQQAESWKEGLAGWGQNAERIQRLREKSDFSIYTPGSSAGRAISILSSFRVPTKEIVNDRDLFAEQIGAIAGSLLGLIGVDSDPLTGREHILVSKLLEHSWLAGKDLELVDLVNLVQSPPLEKIGAFDLESFFPSKDRFGLAMKLNNLLASPGFEVWLEGEALDIDSLLYTESGKPRVCIFSIAHLSESRRMFFVSLLLNQLLAWMRTQSGSTSLRTLFYMDEIYGYFPPVANPPSKKPLMNLLKQARAFGLGLMLATQNPGDLDYKGLSNIGTWFVGRLQTERDKEKVRDGLGGISDNGGSKNGDSNNRAASDPDFNDLNSMDSQELDDLISGLSSRKFLVKNVHEEGLRLIETRWAMSYLRGPFSREEIKKISGARKDVGDRKRTEATIYEGVANASEKNSAQTEQVVTQPVKDSTQPERVATRPVQDSTRSDQDSTLSRQKTPVGPGVREYFVPAPSNFKKNELEYRPTLFVSARARFSRSRPPVDLEREYKFVFPLSKGDATSVNFEKATPVKFTLGQLESTGDGQGLVYAELPVAATRLNSYDGWEKDVRTWLYKNESVTVYKSNALKESSDGNESKRDFLIRLNGLAREKRDEMIEKLRKKYDSKISRIQKRINSAERVLEREKRQADDARIQSAFNIGASLLGAFVGRRKTISGNIRRASSAARSASRAAKQSQDVGEARQKIDELTSEMENLEERFREEMQELESDVESLLHGDLKETRIRPKKVDIEIQKIALVWAPAKLS